MNDEYLTKRLDRINFEAGYLSAALTRTVVRARESGLFTPAQLQWLAADAQQQLKDCAAAVTAMYDKTIDV